MSEQRECPTCGAAITAQDKFCGECGTRTTPATPEDTQVISPDEAHSEATEAAQGASTESRGQGPDRGALFLMAGAAAVVVLLLVAGGAAGIGPAAGLLGGSGSSEPPANGGNGGNEVEAPPTPEPPDASQEPPAPTTISETTTGPVSEGTQGSTQEMTLAETTEGPEGTEAEPGQTSSSVPSESGLVAAVENYYEAVDRADWAYTYENLDGQTQALFEPGEWEQKNQWYTSNYPAELTGLEVEVLDMASTGSSSAGAIAEVAVYREFDGEDAPVRETAFVYEGGEWKHRFIGEELELFRPDLTYEEFVEEQE